MFVQDAANAEVVCSLSKHFGNIPPLQIEELRDVSLFCTKVCPIPKDTRWRLMIGRALELYILVMPMLFWKRLLCPVRSGRKTFRGQEPC